jgi:hypothetical protein
MRNTVPLTLLLAALTAMPGCAVLERLGPRDAPSSTSAASGAETPPPANPARVGQGASAAVLDQTTAAEKAQALAAPPATGERALGKVAASLGSPAEQGFWLRAAIVPAAGKGRVVTAGGKSVAVDLIPGESGAQLSLAAFRALGLSLTDLPEVTVYAQ